MKILLLSRYGNLGASSRYRSYQYLSYLKTNGFDITFFPLFTNDYLKSLYLGQKKSFSYILKVYGKRIFQLRQVNKFDLVWIEYEALPWLPARIEHGLGLSSIPYVVDYDDAIFHRYDQHESKLVRMFLGHKIDQVMRRAALVLAGNDYLAERARLAGAKNIQVLPTVIDLKRYPKILKSVNKFFTIGWIGSPSTSKYLTLITPALTEFCKRVDTQVVLIGAGKVDLPGVPVKFIPWSECTEVEFMQCFDVGIMPLPDNPWERGKCGFKLIQYMACSCPVVGSPVGVNKKIIKHGVNGYQAETINEWIQAFMILNNNKEERRRMGESGRKLVEKQYCLQVTAPRLSSLLRSIC